MVESCEHCGRHHSYDSEDCVMRPEECERCGKVWAREDMFWAGDDLIGDCCDPGAPDA